MLQKPDFTLQTKPPVTLISHACNPCQSALKPHHQCEFMAVVVIYSNNSGAAATGLREAESKHTPQHLIMTSYLFFSLSAVMLVQ